MQAPRPGNHIVVGIDGSRTALAAARWATVFAEKLDLPLHLVHSSPAPGAVPERAADATELTELHRTHRDELLSEARASVRERAPDIDLELVTDHEPPDVGLLKAADNAYMIVLGATGAGSVERWLLGSTALRVANRAQCPVAVRCGNPVETFPEDEPIVVGTDGSRTSYAAIRLAFEWAQLFSVPVAAVRAWTDSTAVGSSVPTAMQMFGPSMTVDWDTVARSEAETLSTILAPYRREFPDVAVQEWSRRGSAPRELLHALDHAQMAIVGSKGWGRFRGSLLGSTSQNLLHRAHRPVIVHRATGT